MALTDNQKNALQVMQSGYPALWAEIANGQEWDAITAGKEASRIIGAIVKAVQEDSGGLWPWKYWTKQSVCAHALYEAHGDIQEAMQSLEASLGKIKALRFQKNARAGQPRIDLTGKERRAALRTQMLVVKDDVALKLAQEAIAELKAAETPKPEPERHAPEPTPPPFTPHPWIIFIRDARQLFLRHNADGEAMDEWGMRQAEYGALMLNEGFPIAALKHAATLHLPKEARRSLGVTEFDPMSFRTEQRRAGMHAVLPYLLGLHRSGVPAAMVGGKGTGKSTLAKQMTHLLFDGDLSKFALINMTSATSPSAFYGRPKIGGDGSVVESAFTRICKLGGIILLDEMDASDENLLLIANSAIANRIFYNQQTGETIVLHPDAYFMAGMNTLGLGATRHYNARNKQDAALLDRFSMGRTIVGLDEDLEDAIFYGILNNAPVMA